MEYRTFGRLGWKVSEIGHGMWGMGGQWKGSTDDEGMAALQRSFELGCNFYDTAWMYGQGHSENLFRQILSAKQKLGQVYIATKVPPKNPLLWPGKPEHNVEDMYPKDSIIEYAHKSLENLGVETIDLLQLHTWDDSWAKADGWKEAVAELKSQKLIKGFGISINKWQPENVFEALKTDLIDAVQVVYNIFEQAPEDKLFPECKKRNIAVIARVPFDEGILTGAINKDTVFEKDDWRVKFFTEDMLTQALVRMEKIKQILPSYMELFDLALRYILANDAISTVIPGMRKVQNVDKNIAVSDGKGIDKNLYAKLKSIRWDRTWAEFS